MGFLDKLRGGGADGELMRQSTAVTQAWLLERNRKFEAWLRAKIARLEAEVAAQEAHRADLAGVEPSAVPGLEVTRPTPLRVDTPLWPDEAADASTPADDWLAWSEEVEPEEPAAEAAITAPVVENDAGVDVSAPAVDDWQAWLTGEEDGSPVEDQAGEPEEVEPEEPAAEAAITAPVVENDAGVDVSAPAVDDWQAWLTGEGEQGSTGARETGGPETEIPVLDEETGPAEEVAITAPADVPEDEETPADEIIEWDWAVPASPATGDTLPVEAPDNVEDAGVISGLEMNTDESPTEETVSDDEDEGGWDTALEGSSVEVWS